MSMTTKGPGPCPDRMGVRVRVWAELECAREKGRRFRGELFGCQRSCGHKRAAILMEKQRRPGTSVVQRAPAA